MKNLDKWNSIVSGVCSKSTISPIFETTIKDNVQCKQCETLFIGSKRFRFCSDSCAKIYYENQKKIKSEQARQKRRIGYASGVLFGKQIWEVIFERYKGSAKKRNLSFELTPDDFLSFWQKPCTYCGDKIETIGLDREDSDLGYKIGNVVPCCTICNLSKRNQKPEDYVARCIKIARKCGYFLPERP